MDMSEEYERKLSLYMEAIDRISALEQQVAELKAKLSSIQRIAEAAPLPSVDTEG